MAGGLSGRPKIKAPFHHTRENSAVAFPVGRVCVRAASPSAGPGVQTCRPLGIQPGNFCSKGERENTGSCEGSESG